MLEKLQLINFQGHRRLTIELDSGVTTIVGPSDIGKSAILRALRWLATNRPAGDAFIRDGTRHTTVRLWAEGQEITRRRGRKGNLYRLNDKEFRAFGNDVPDAIVQLLNVSDINFQGQHDNPFWFAETAGEVSRRLNRIFQLDVIDHTINHVAAAQRKSAAEITVVKERYRAAQFKIQALRPIVQCDKDLKTVERIEEEADKLTLGVLALGDLYVQALTSRRTVQRLTRQQRALDSLLKVGDEWLAKNYDAGLLSGLLQQAKRQAHIVDRPAPDLSNIETLAETHEQLQEAAKDLSKLYEEAVRLDKLLTNKNRQLAEAEVELDKVLGESKLCPLCGQSIKVVRL